MSGPFFHPLGFSLQVFMRIDQWGFLNVLRQISRHILVSCLLLSVAPTEFEEMVGGEPAPTVDGRDREVAPTTTSRMIGHCPAA